jgi:exonuclease V
MSDDGYGTDIEFTQELQDVLHEAESHTTIALTRESVSPALTHGDDVMDIEDLVQPSPFEEFKNGYLSVTDLVGTVWCEVQASAISPSVASQD